MKNITLKFGDPISGPCPFPGAVGLRAPIVAILRQVEQPKALMSHISTPFEPPGVTLDHPKVRSGRPIIPRPAIAGA